MENNQYLNNDQVERESWELIGADVRFTEELKGEVDMKFAYRPNIQDTFRIKDNKVLFIKYFPDHVKREVISLIKLSMPGAKPKKAKVKREIPVPITITRVFKRKLKNNNE